MTKNGLIIIAHGSRNPASNQEVLDLTNRVSLLAKEKYAITQVAFLELAKPSLDDCIADCIQKGVTKIVILPYFLASGTHVTKDIPSLVREAQNRYMDISIVLKSHLGSSESIALLLFESVKDEV